MSNLTSLVNAVFGAGSPNANSALGKLNNLDKQLQQGDTAGAQDQARNIVAFVQTKATQSTLPGTRAQIQALISGVLCYAGLSPDTFLIFPSDAPQVVKNAGGNAGLSLQGNTVNVPTLITITILPTNSPPLITKLDQYPGYIALTQSSPLTKPAVVGVCPASSVPAEVLGRLRLGHQAATGFEITPAANASFLDCSTATAQSSRMPHWLQRLASFIMPTPLYAKTMESAGVGGLATEFSPFAPVDDELFLAGGVGGTRTEFNKIPTTDSLKLRLPAPSDATARQAPNRSLAPGNRLNTVVNGVCTQIDAIVGTAVEQECRPVVTLKTFQGTILQNVPIGWSIGLGAGVIAPEATVAHTCGAFSSTASTATNANGDASVCWTLGSTQGTNTVVATGAAGGDAPLGVTFNGTITFTATAKQITPTVGATGGSFVYDGLPHAGSGTCSNSLTPALSYSGNGSVPTDVGSYTLTVTCGAGDPLYVTVTQTAPIQITPATTTTAVTCPATLVFTGLPLTPCTANVTSAGGLNQSLTPTYSGNVNAGTATASAAYAGGGNYQPSSGSSTFQVTRAATTTVASCPASVVFTGSAQTPCSAMVTGPGLSAPVAPSYVSNVNTGTATANATYAGSGNYLGSSGSSTFQIGGAATVASVSCPVSVVYTGVAVTPCSGSVTGPGLSQSVTPTYSSNVVGVATATVNYAGGGNYLPSTASKTFQILYAQSGCFASPIYNVMPTTKSFQNKGSNVPIKCTLLTAQGTGVSNASGDLLVQDMGTNGLATPVTAFSLANAFRSTTSGNYAYGLDTSPSGFVSTHYYFVTVTWSDGSKTTGWFYIK